MQRDSFIDRKKEQKRAVHRNCRTWCMDWLWDVVGGSETSGEGCWWGATDAFAGIPTIALESGTNVVLNGRSSWGCSTDSTNVGCFNAWKAETRIGGLCCWFVKEKREWHVRICRTVVEICSPVVEHKVVPTVDLHNFLIWWIMGTIICLEVYVTYVGYDCWFWLLVRK